MHGLKQSPHVYFVEIFTKIMVSLGYKLSREDCTLFFKHSQ